jgi:hypothetical protein
MQTKIASTDPTVIGGVSYSFGYVQDKKYLAEGIVPEDYRYYLSNGIYLPI